MATQSANQGADNNGVTVQGYNANDPDATLEAIARYRASREYRRLPSYARAKVDERLLEAETRAQELKTKGLWESTLPEGGILAADNPMFDISAPELQQYEAGPELEATRADWKEQGPSAFATLGVDGRAVEGYDQAQDYFQNLASGGRDAVADAEYARRAEQAERSRRANSDAAVRELDMMGRGGSGASLLARLVGAQGEASDRYQAGLDAGAMSQQRRDNAAATGANVAQMRAGSELAADTARAGGVDAWNEWDASSGFAADSANADREQAARTANWQRAATVSDANVDQENEKRWWDGPGKAAEMWNRQQGALAGATGQQNLYISNARQDIAANRAARRTPMQMISGAIDTGAKVYGAVT